MPVSREYVGTSGEYMPLPGNIRYIVRVGTLICLCNGAQDPLSTWEKLSPMEAKEVATEGNVGVHAQV